MSPPSQGLSSGLQHRMGVRTSLSLCVCVWLLREPPIITLVCVHIPENDAGPFHDVVLHWGAADAFWRIILQSFKIDLAATRGVSGKPPQPFLVALSKRRRAGVLIPTTLQSQQSTAPTDHPVMRCWSQLFYKLGGHGEVPLCG